MGTKKAHPARVTKRATGQKVREDLPATTPAALRGVNPYNLTREQRDAFQDFTRTFHTEIARGKLDRLEDVLQEITVQKQHIQQRAKLAIQKDLKRIEQLYRRAETFRRFGLEPEKVLKGRVTFKGPRTKGYAAPDYKSMLDLGGPMPSIRGRGRPPKADAYDSIFTQSPDGFLVFRDVEDANRELGLYDDELDTVEQGLSQADQVLSTSQMLQAIPGQQRAAMRQLGAGRPPKLLTAGSPPKLLTAGNPPRKLLTAGSRG